MATQQSSEILVLEKVTVYDVIISAKNWFLYFLKNWWIIGIAVILSGAGGIMYAARQQVQYESRLTFALEENSSLSGAVSLAAELGLDLGGSKNVFAGDNIIVIMTSRRIIERVLLTSDTLNGRIRTIADIYKDVSGVTKALQKNQRLNKINFPTGIVPEKFSYLQDSLLYLMYKDVLNKKLKTSKPDKKLNNYEVKFLCNDERLCKVVTERLVKETSDFYVELRTKRSKGTLNILESRVASLKGNVYSAISQKLAVQDANVNPAFAAAQAPLQKSQLDISVYGGAYAELFKNLELARFQYLKDVPLLQIIDAPRYPLTKIKEGRFKTGIIFGLIGAFVILVVLALKRYLKEAAKVAAKL